MVHARSLFFAALAFCVGTSLNAQSGAIFTTDQNAVNSNTFTSTKDVYVSQSGLPDDKYFFQVTNSSGTELLSDPFGDDPPLVLPMGGGEMTLRRIPVQ